jgi:hypothetical protein
MRSFLFKFIKICPKTGRFRGFKKTTGLSKLLFPIIGIAAIVWILIRVIPKPSRAEYPCMKIAAPIASGFIIYIGGLTAAVFSFKKAKVHFRDSKFGYAILFVIAALTIGSFTSLKSDNDYVAQTKLSIDSLFVPKDSANHPIGTAKGIFPGRVVWMHDPSVSTWNGTTGHWWDTVYLHQKIVDSMLSKSLHSLSGKTNDAGSWDAIFKYFNINHGKGNVGYQAGEKIAVKINLNNSTVPNPGVTKVNPGNLSVATPQTVLSLLRQLVNKAGVQDSNITVYDLIRYVTDPIYSMCKAEFPHVHFVGWAQMNGREKYVRDTTRIRWSQPLILEKDTSVSAKGGNPTYLPTAVTHAAYLINLANLKGHSYAGMTSCAKNHFGSLSVDDDHGQPYIWAPHAAGVHAYVSVHDASWSAQLAFKARLMGTYNPLVDLMGHKDLGNKTLLFMVDALYAAPNEHGVDLTVDSKWLSAPFNKYWTCSFFLSQDNVAIESVALDFIRTEQAINSNIVFVNGALDNYLHEAALADNPPSGTYYAPSGVHLQSLGVHEHWNNATNKQYTRNLDPVNGKGIELVQLTGTVTSVKENNSIPSGYSLSQNYPNPFNPTTIIRYQIPKEGLVTIKLYDVVGKEIRTLVNAHQTPGNYSYNINASRLASGIYIYKINVNNFTQSKKMVLMR